MALTKSQQWAAISVLRIILGTLIMGYSLFIGNILLGVIAAFLVMLYVDYRAGILPEKLGGSWVSGPRRE